MGTTPRLSQLTADRRPARAGFWRSVALMAGMAVGAAPGGSCPVAAAQSAPRSAARQGEAYTFSLKFLGSVDAGRARLAVSPPTNGPNGPQITVIAEAEATGFAKALTGLHEDYRLILDGTTWLPRRMQLVESGLRIRTAVIDVTDRRVEVSSKMPTGERHWSGLLPTQPLEPIAVLLLLRAARLQNGDKLALVVMDGTAFYQGTMEIVGREEIASAFDPSGTQRAIKIVCRGERITENGVKVGRPPRIATLWVSDTAARLPLRVEGETELGKAEFALTGYEPGRRPLPLPKQLLGIVEQLAPSSSLGDTSPPPQVRMPQLQPPER